MSQEYTEDKDVVLQPLSSGRRLLEALLILVALFAIYLMVSLVTFNPSDPSWSQTAWHEPIHNLGGAPGAWMADTLLFVFGVMGYAIPPVIVGLCWKAFRQRDNQDYIDYFAIGLRLIGVLALVVTTCGLAALNADDIWYFASGGVIGSLISSAIAPYLNPVVSTLALLVVWAAGITLYTGWSWLTIAERIGGVVMGVLTFASNRSRHDEPWQEEEEEEYTDEQHTAEPLTAVARQESDEEDDVLLAAPRRPDEVPQAPAENAATIALPSDPLLATAAAATAAAVHQAAVAMPAAAIPVAAAQSSAVQPTTSAQPLNEQPPVAATPQPLSSVAPAAFSQPVSSGVAQPESVQTAATAGSQAQPAFTGNTSQPAPTEQAPPLYRFEVPESQGSAFSVYEEDDGPQMGNWRSATETGAAAVAASSVAAAAPLFDLAPESESNPQVKQGIGPSLPRPNPVKLPTRRERASWGIKLPSQRMAEEKAKAEQKLANTEQVPPQVDLAVPHAAEQEWSSEEQDTLQQAELRHAFAAQQQDRYGADWQLSSAQEEDDEAQQQAELARQFAAQQQTRYAPEPPVQKPVLDLGKESIFDLSPMKDLVDEGPGEPLFTLSATPEPTAPAAPAVTVTPPSSYHHQHSPFEMARQRQAAAAQAAAAEVQPEPPVEPEYQPQASSYFAPEPAVPEPVAPAQEETAQTAFQESLFHPFLVRHEQPLEKPSTPLPTLDLLTSPPLEEEPVDMFALEQTARLVEARLGDYRVKAEVVGISPGPVITRFELDLAPGVKASRISNLSRDLARSLSAVAVRVVEVIPGKPYVGLELPNRHRQTVYLREVLDCPQFRENTSPLAIVLGKDIAGQPVVADLAKMPHLLVAGTTGSGKSVGVNAMILSMLYKATPEEVRFIMIDPKMLELSVYEGIPHLLTEVVTDMKDAANALRWSVGEMERRYKLMSALGVRNLAGYNEKVQQAEAMGRPIPDPFWKPGDSMDTSPPVLEKLPYIVVMVDEFADLMMAVGKKVEELIARLAQKARAAGIHLVLATQRPSVDVITGLIKANIPTRIAFTVSSKIDSRTILDQGGAESLLGMGDMLYMPPNSSMPVRVHGAFVRDEEVHAVVQDWKARGRPQYIDSITAGEEGEGGGASVEGGDDLDPLFDQAVAFVVDKRRASISGVQRQFRIGYNRAARIIEQMEAQGIVSEPGHNGNREVLSPPSHEM